VGTTTWTTKKIKNTNQFLNVTGLTNNTNYEWQVAGTDTSSGGSTTNSAYVAGPDFTTQLRVGETLSTAQTDALNVYPNPVSGSVHVSFENGTEGEVMMRLFDVNGKIIFVQNQSEASGTVIKELDLSGLVSGVYQLQVITADGSVLNQSIVKAKE
jgi:hypothetical protein